MTATSWSPQPSLIPLLPPVARMISKENLPTEPRPLQCSDSYPGFVILASILVSAKKKIIGFVMKFSEVYHCTLLIPFLPELSLSSFM